MSETPIRPPGNPDPFAKLAALEQRALVAEGGAARIERQHQAGKLTARERHRQSAGSPAALSKWTSWSCSRSTDFGMAENRDPWRWGGDRTRAGTWPADVCGFPGFTVFGGSLSEAYAGKICKIMDLAMKVGAPCRWACATRVERASRKAWSRWAATPTSSCATPSRPG